MIRATLWLLVLAGVAAGTLALAAPLPEPVRKEVASSRRGADSAAAVDRDLLEALPARAPFRLSRRPALVPYRAGWTEPPVSTALRPVLILRGLLGGSEAVAALEGIPGIPGHLLVKVGDTVGGLRVERISRGRVVVSGYDTTWVLRLDSVPAAGSGR